MANECNSLYEKTLILFNLSSILEGSELCQNILYVNGRHELTIYVSIEGRLKNQACLDTLNQAGR